MKTYMVFAIYAIPAETTPQFNLSNSLGRFYVDVAKINFQWGYGKEGTGKTGTFIISAMLSTCILTKSHLGVSGTPKS